MFTQNNGENTHAQSCTCTITSSFNPSGNIVDEKKKTEEIFYDVQFFMVTAMQTMHYSFSSRPFKRVLELPSENWLELAQDWCCHGSSHLTSVAGALEPGEDDCFVGEHYIKVHPATVAADNLQILPVS